MALAPKDIYAKIQQKFGAAVEQVVDTEAGDPFCLVRGERIRDICLFLRDDPALRFDFPTCLTGYDDRTHLWVVYHLWSVPRRHLAVLKVKCPREGAHVPSVTDVWKGMDWHERETYDLVGIVFDGHPDLRRILLPEDWPGHPLRKDYKFPEQHWGVPLR